MAIFFFASDCKWQDAKTEVIFLQNPTPILTV